MLSDRMLTRHTHRWQLGRSDLWRRQVDVTAGAHPTHHHPYPTAQPYPHLMQFTVGKRSEQPVANSWDGMVRSSASTCTGGGRGISAAQGYTCVQDSGFAVSDMCPQTRYFAAHGLARCQATLVPEKQLQPRPDRPLSAYPEHHTLLWLRHPHLGLLTPREPAGNGERGPTKGSRQKVSELGVCVCMRVCPAKQGSLHCAC